MKPSYLFVYGTLMSTHDNPWARKLRREADFAGKAHVPAKLVRLGRYFALVPKGRGWIPGEIYQLRIPSMTLRLLDCYEGPRYRRMMGRVRISSGGVLRAWMYVGTTYARGL